MREPAQHVRQPDGAERAHRPEREPAARVQAREVLHLRRRGRDLAGDLLRARQQRLARLGEPDRAAGAREQLHAQRRFELLDVVRHRRLREPEPFAGAREVAVARDRAEARELAELQCGGDASGSS